MSKADDLKIAQWINHYSHVIEIQSIEICEFLGLRYTGKPESKQSYTSSVMDAMSLFIVLTRKNYNFIFRNEKSVCGTSFYYVMQIMSPDLSINIITRMESIVDCISCAVLELIDKEGEINANL